MRRPREVLDIDEVEEEDEKVRADARGDEAGMQEEAWSFECVGGVTERGQCAGGAEEEGAMRGGGGWSGNSLVVAYADLFAGGVAE
jgi:hypothetical protein